MAKRGARSKLNPATVGAVCRLLSIGASATCASTSAGITIGTYCGWRNQGERDLADGKPDTPHAEFFKRTEAAKAARQARDLEVVEAAVSGALGLDPGGQLKAAQWRLTYIDRGDFHPRSAASTEHTHTAAAGGTTLDLVAVLMGGVTDLLPKPSDDEATPDGTDNEDEHGDG